MKKTFRTALMTLGSMFLLMSFMFIGIIFTPENSQVYEALLGVMVVLFCSSPLVVLVAAVSGIGALLERFDGSQKRKREFHDFDLDYDGDQLANIMQRLTPEQQAYLEERLQQQRLGLGSDGEIVSLDDLFEESKQKRKFK
ncbi:MAG: hypothetical protein ACFE0Q_15900 [Anaerolineae bacterium]